MLLPWPFGFEEPLLLAALVEVAIVLGHLIRVARRHLIAATAADLAAGGLIDLATHL